MEQKRANSASPWRPQPSARFGGMEAAERRIREVHPYISSRGNGAVIWETASIPLLRPHGYPRPLERVCDVLPALRRLEKRNAFNDRILAVQRSRFSHYYFNIRDETLDETIRVGMQGDFREVGLAAQISTIVFSGFALK